MKLIAVFAVCFVSVFGSHAHAGDILDRKPWPLTNPMTREEAAVQLLHFLAPIGKEIAEKRKSGEIKTDADTDRVLASKGFDEKTKDAMAKMHNETLAEIQFVVASVSKSDPEYKVKLDRAFDIVNLEITLGLDEVAIQLSLSKQLTPADSYEAQRLLMKHDLLAGRFTSAAWVDSDRSYLRVRGLLLEKLVNFEPSPSDSAKTEGEKRDAGEKTGADHDATLVEQPAKPAQVPAAQ